VEQALAFIASENFAQAYNAGAEKLGYFRKERGNCPCNASALLSTSSARRPVFAVICANSAVYGYSARQAKQRIMSIFSRERMKCSQWHRWQ
jgi:hypothetical protein